MRASGRRRGPMPPDIHPIQADDPAARARTPSDRPTSRPIVAARAQSAAIAVLRGRAAARQAARPGLSGEAERRIRVAHVEAVDDVAAVHRHCRGVVIALVGARGGVSGVTNPSACNNVRNSGQHLGLALADLRACVSSKTHVAMLRDLAAEWVRKGCTCKRVSPGLRAAAGSVHLGNTHPMT
jgi:hypothetical protein